MSITDNLNAVLHTPWFKVTTDGSCRSLADCAADFQRHNLPLHCLINNVGTLSPEDDKSADGFDVRMMLHVCT